MGSATTRNLLHVKHSEAAREQAEVKKLAAQTALYNVAVIAAAWVVFCMMAVVAVYSIRLGQTIWGMDTLPLPPMLGGT